MAWWNTSKQTESEAQPETAQQDYAGQQDGVNAYGVPYLHQQVEQAVSAETIAVMRSLGYSLDDIKQMSSKQ